MFYSHQSLDNPKNMKKVTGKKKGPGRFRTARTHPVRTGKNVSRTPKYVSRTGRYDFGWLCQKKKVPIPKKRFRPVSRFHTHLLGELSGIQPSTQEACGGTLPLSYTGWPVEGPPLATSRPRDIQYTTWWGLSADSPWGYDLLREYIKYFKLSPQKTLWSYEMFKYLVGT